jgi:hypothetical protein
MTSDVSLSSAFGLTCLLFIGLAFFIRASIKDRTEEAWYQTEMSDVTLLESLQIYFSQRAYRVTEVDDVVGQITLAGKVRASWFLAIFLGGLAAIGCFCLALVVAISFPQTGYLPYGLVIFAPLASWFYWQGSTRLETIRFRFDVANSYPEGTADRQTRLAVVAHRDELAVLENQLPIKRIEAEETSAPI